MIICASTFSGWRSDFCASDDHEDHEDHEDHDDHDDHDDHEDHEDHDDHEDHEDHDDPDLLNHDLGGCSGICAGDGAICSKSAHLCCLWSQLQKVWMDV